VEPKPEVPKDPLSDNPEISQLQIQMKAVNETLDNQNERIKMLIKSHDALDQTVSMQAERINKLTDMMEASIKAFEHYTAIVKDHATSLSALEKIVQKLDDQIATIIRAARDRGGELDKVINGMNRELSTVATKVEELQRLTPVDGQGNADIARVTQVISNIEMRLDALDRSVLMISTALPEGTVMVSRQ
jgi:phage-related tail protein